MPAIIDLCLLTLALSICYAGLGVLSLAFEQGAALWLRRSRRSRAPSWQRVRRRSARPRRRPGAVAVPRSRPLGAAIAGL